MYTRADIEKKETTEVEKLKDIKPWKQIQDLDQKWFYLLQRQ